jgi:hypothetical protein
MSVSIGTAVASIVSGIALAINPAPRSYSDCTFPYVCISDNYQWNGTGNGQYMWTWDYIWSKPGHCLNLTGSQNNMASAVYNHSDVQVRFFNHTNCVTSGSEPEYYTVCPECTVQFQGNPGNPAMMNNKVSSIYAWNTN